MSDKSKFSEKRRIGNLGEDLVCNYLKDAGFSIEARNYLKKYGEIDIVARNKRTNVIHFIEVKSKVISRESSDKNALNILNSVSRLFSQNSFTINKFKIDVSCENSGDIEGEQKDDYRPEENVDPWKQKRLIRVIETYIVEKEVENEWQVDVITIKLDFSKNNAIINHIGNVVLEE